MARWSPTTRSRCLAAATLGAQLGANKNSGEAQCREVVPSAYSLESRLPDLGVEVLEQGGGSLARWKAL